MATEVNRIKLNRATGFRKETEMSAKTAIENDIVRVTLGQLDPSIEYWFCERLSKMAGVAYMEFDANTHRLRGYGVHEPYWETFRFWLAIGLEYTAMTEVAPKGSHSQRNSIGGSMSKKPNAASKAWNDKGLLLSEKPNPYAKRKGTNDNLQRGVIIQKQFCVRCQLDGHTADSHFDRFQFERPIEIEVDGEPVRDYNGE